jgi:hypothetical protein
MSASFREYKDPEEGDVNYKEKVFYAEAQSTAIDVIKVLGDKKLSDNEKKLRCTDAKLEQLAKARMSSTQLLNLKVKDYGLFVRAQQANRLAIRAEAELKKFHEMESNIHLQMKVESCLSESAAETIDMTSPEAKRALERLSVAFPSVREEAEKSSFLKGSSAVAVNATPLVPAELTGELKNIYDLYKKYDLSETQLKVMNLLAHPNICIEQYGSLNNESIAACLGLDCSVVSAAFDKRLMATLFNESILSLRMSKFMVDGALLASASNPDSRNTSDRQLYYRLIGALQDKSDQTIIDKIPREKKLEVISKTIAKLTKNRDEAAALKERLLKENQ